MYPGDYGRIAVVWVPNEGSLNSCDTGSAAVVFSWRSHPGNCDSTMDRWSHTELSNRSADVYLCGGCDDTRPGCRPAARYGGTLRGAYPGRITNDDCRQLHALRSDVRIYTGNRGSDWRTSAPPLAAGGLLQLVLDRINYQCE